MRGLLSFILLAAAATAEEWQTRLTKPGIHRNLDFLEEGLQRYLPEISFVARKWNNNKIPKEY